MIAHDPPDAVSAPASPGPERPGWQERTGLTLREAEDLLDWLEAHGFAEREALVTEDGVIVRWRA